MNEWIKANESKDEIGWNIYYMGISSEMSNIFWWEIGMKTDHSCSRLA